MSKKLYRGLVSSLFVGLFLVSSGFAKPHRNFNEGKKSPKGSFYTNPAARTGTNNNYIPNRNAGFPRFGFPRSKYQNSTSHFEAMKPSTPGDRFYGFKSPNQAPAQLSELQGALNAAFRANRSAGVRDELTNWANDPDQARFLRDLGNSVVVKNVRVDVFSNAEKEISDKAAVDYLNKMLVEMGMQSKTTGLRITPRFIEMPAEKNPTSEPPRAEWKSWLQGVGVPMIFTLGAGYFDYDRGYEDLLKVAIDSGSSADSLRYAYWIRTGAQSAVIVGLELQFRVISSFWAKVFSAHWLPNSTNFMANLLNTGIRNIGLGSGFGRPNLSENNVGVKIAERYGTAFAVNFLYGLAVVGMTVGSDALTSMGGMPSSLDPTYSVPAELTKQFESAAKFSGAVTLFQAWLGERTQNGLMHGWNRWKTEAWAVTGNNFFRKLAWIGSGEKGVQSAYLANSITTAFGVLITLPLILKTEWGDRIRNLRFKQNLFEGVSQNELFTKGERRMLACQDVVDLTISLPSRALSATLRGIGLGRYAKQPVRR